jgi:uncharacterized protein
MAATGRNAMSKHLSGFCRRLLPVVLLACAAVPPAIGRELAVAPSQLLPAELVAVQVLGASGMAVVLLDVGSGQGELPMFTGSAEAEALGRAWQQDRPPRPLTHELLGDVLEATGWRVERLVIDELRDGQFLAALELRNEAGETRLVDSRPSDGLVLALRQGAKVQVAREVLEQAEEQDPDSTPRRVLTADAVPRPAASAG